MRPGEGNGGDGIAGSCSSCSSGSEEDLTASVNRSRKRYLSPSILRGDQAVHRLQAQEISASPDLKRVRTGQQPDGMALSADEFRATMAGLNKRFDGIDDSLSSVTSTVTRLDKKVSEHGDMLNKHTAVIEKNERDLASIQTELMRIKSGQSVVPPPTGAAPALAPVPSDDDFDKARRSLRLWPITGTAPAAVWKSMGEFLHRLLGLGNIGENLIENIARPRRQSSYLVKDEAIVLFKLVETRDSVIGASAKLANMVDANRRPTAGIRLEVPNMLRPAFNTLRRYGHQLKMRHGPGTRHHVKFDDDLKTMFLNVKLPEEERWSRVELDLARRGLQLRDRLSSQEMEDRFDIAGAPSSRPRPASTSSASSEPPAPTPMQWTGRRSESSSS